MKGWKAILRKEFRSEFRQRSGLVTSLLFSLFTVVAISFATYDLKISPQLASGLLSVAFLFAAIIALPRTMLVEEEQGTGDLLRVMAKPEDVYWGKAVFNLAFMAANGVILAGLFLGFTATPVAHFGLFLGSFLGSCIAFAGTVTLCGALVTHTSNRSALAGVLAVPLLLPLTFLEVSGLRVAFDTAGSFNLQNGLIAGFGVVCYGLATFAIGPYLFAAVWKR